MRKLYVKLVAVLIVTFMGVGLMAGCGNSAASKENTLYIYNWSEYIPKDGKFWVAKAASVKSKLFSPSDIQKIMKKAMVDRLGAFYGRTHFDETGIEFGTYLVTGNKKHFPQTPIVVTPAEMLDIIESL